MGCMRIYNHRVNRLSFESMIFLKHETFVLRDMQS